MSSHSTIEFATVIDEIYLFILSFISIKITYSTILNKLNEQRSVLSKVQRTFLFPWNNHSTVQISRSFRTPFARLRRKLLRTIRSVEKRNELKTIITLLDLLLLLLFYAISQPRLLRMLDFPVFRFAPPLLCLSTQDFSNKKKKKRKRRT